MDCIFCKIISGEIPSMVVYEDEFSCVFMDIAEDVDGHMLAVPMKHAESILDCDADTLAHLIKAVKTVSNHLVDRCGYKGVNLLNASGECAGQSIPHFHIHLIPRKRGDGVDAWPKLPGSKEELEEVFRRIKLT